ncbi:MAG: hypothetical protein R3C60_09215 [Parvularculaceae bacterium]
MTDEVITKHILKFVRQLDGFQSEERVLQSAIERCWLDKQGSPTLAGRNLIHSFDILEKAARPSI